MKDVVLFSAYVLTILLTWAAVVVGTIFLIRHASLAGFAVLAAIGTIAWMVNVGDKR